MEARRPSRPRLLLFAFGDFAFNLYWQSIMLFLLFYYTDALELPIGVASTTYLIASVWDGIASFVVGILVDRRHATLRYGAILIAGAIPLGLCFMLTYMPPLTTGSWAIASILGAHLLFRTAYAAVNVPYLAMTARISADTDDRAFVAGTRMLFGTAAAVTVALATVPVGRWLTGSTASEAYFGAAVLFAVVGTIILMFVGATYREATTIERPLPGSVRAALVSLARNRAFVTLSAAMMAMIVAITVLNKSVLYYFKYLLNDPEAGQLALASMGIVSGIAIPLWMVFGRVIGLRALWLIAAGLGMATLLVFAAIDVHESGLMQIFLIMMQVMIVGLNFVFWAMLPNTVEYGERETGLHVEGTVFGVAALLQRIAIGIATAILGWGFAGAGYVANVQQSAGTLSGMRATIVIVPLIFLALSCVAMLANPLGRAPHGRADPEPA
ncbi:MFS transporter [Sphingomonas sp. SM33]|uniref:MFS transporter n=1 Tax=Sphingomonas telluris TaxID=2907998 RepID=A0ABS9VNN1_9SPHN|nr:MFS transporter [Sphingomonas telluris]MCH8616119.1 MFS transporter [Sphingomonas telluris]